MPLIRRNITIRRSRAADWARIAGGLALPVLVIGVVGVRAGIVPQVALQPVLVAGFALGIAAIGLALFALADIWMSGVDGAGSAFMALFYASPVLVVLGLVTAAVIVYPRLSDVTTDVDDPPLFVEGGAAHKLPGPESVARQVAAYPQIVPRVYPLPLGDVFVAARKIMELDGWTITREERPEALPMATSRENPKVEIAEDDELALALAAKSVMTQSRAGLATETLPDGDLPTEADLPEVQVPEPKPTNVATLEATAPTLVFGFIDDVVVRMTITEDGSTRVDMRSASRVGAHDLGENSRRIKSFFAALDAVLQPEPGAAGSGVASASR